MPGIGSSGSGGNDKEMKNGWKLFKDFATMARKAKANDTEGTNEAFANLASDLIKMSATNMTEEDYPMLDAYMHGMMTNDTDTNSTDYTNQTESMKNFFKEKVGWSRLHKDHNSNWTDYDNNSTDSLFPNITDMSTGLSDFDLGLDKFLDPYDLNKKYTQPSFFCIVTGLTMITFFYYVPRMLYYRASNFTNDWKQSSFVPIVYLSFIACLGAAIHMANAYYRIANNPIISLFTGGGLIDFDHFIPFIYKALCASINRIVSPIVGLLCLQQISAHGSSRIWIFQNSAFQIIFCAVYTFLIFGYSFYKEYIFMSELESIEYPDPIHVDFVDIIFPLFTAFLFFYGKHTISRKSLYTTEKYGPNGPTTLDRVSKVVIFQTIMVIFAICAIFYSPSVENEKVFVEPATTFYYFFITAQTPAVHFVLFKSLLRSRKSTRLCFLVCCTSGEKVSMADNGVELNQHPRTNEPSEKHEDEEEDEENKEENTMETLDHNKIVIIPEGNLEEGKK